MSENLVKWEKGVKILSRVGRGVSDKYVAFRFGAKLTILGATNGCETNKNVDWSFLCPTYENIFAN